MASSSDNTSSSDDENNYEFTDAMHIRCSLLTDAPMELQASGFAPSNEREGMLVMANNIHATVAAELVVTLAAVVLDVPLKRRALRFGEVNRKRFKKCCKTLISLPPSESRKA